MKLIDLVTYPIDDGDNHFSGVEVDGWELNLLKFRRRSVISLAYDEAIYQSFPSLMAQIGPSDVFQLTLGFVKGYLTLSVWCRHYDD